MVSVDNVVRHCDGHRKWVMVGLQGLVNKPRVSFCKLLGIPIVSRHAAGAGARLRLGVPWIKLCACELRPWMFRRCHKHHDEMAPLSVDWVSADMNSVRVLEMASGHNGRLVMCVRRIGCNDGLCRAIVPCDVEPPRGCDVVWSDMRVRRPPQRVSIALSRPGF